MTDVTNPLLGPNGASAVYGPQKGAKQADIPELEATLAHLSKLVENDLGIANSSAGDGAAGGLGFGLRAFLNASLSPGFDAIARATHLHDKLAAADLVVTGEGCFDDQSSSGKGPSQVASLAHSGGKCSVLITGVCSSYSAAQSQFHHVFTLIAKDTSRETALRESRRILTIRSREAAISLRESWIPKQ